MTKDGGEGAGAFVPGRVGLVLSTKVAKSMSARRQAQAAKVRAMLRRLDQKGERDGHD